ncbi:MAG: hypothetical protein PGN08_12525 [Sphingomonas taxi]
MSHLSLRQLAVFLTAIATFHGGKVAQTKSVASPVAAQSPFLGRWELDLTRMPAGYASPPKRVIYDFQDIGGGKWRTTIDITTPDESVRHMVVTYRPDGTAASGEADTSEADSAAIMIPTPNVLVMNLAKNKVPGSVRVYVVAANGKDMTESAAAINDRGEPFVRNFHYRHLP